MVLSIQILLEWMKMEQNLQIFVPEVEMMTFFCDGCHDVKATPARPGPPPKFCAQCTEIGDTEKMMTIFCESCRELKSIPARRGRPPKFCAPCLESGDAETSDEARITRARALAEARCDRLEILLRSRGTHIKQNRSKWE